VQKKQGRITSYLRAGFPCLWVRTLEFERATVGILDELGEDPELSKLSLYQWRVTTGLTPFSPTWDFDTSSLASDFTSSLEWIMDQSEETQESIFIFYNPRFFMDEPAAIQLMLDVAWRLRTVGGAIIIIGGDSRVPEELTDIVMTVDFPLPDREYLKEVFSDMVKSAKAVAEKVTADDLERAADCAVGMSAFVAESSCALSIVESRCLDMELIQAQKKQSIQRSSGALQFMPVSETMDDVGGLDLLKEYFYKRRKFFTKKARDYGLAPPKGVMIIGLPGVGKSLIAKAAAQATGLPLYKFDIASVFKGYVGQSEEEIRLALKIAETAAPCVTGDTVVWTGDGRVVEIEELYAEFCRTGDLTVVAWDELEGKITTTDVTAVTKREAPVFAINAARGFSIKSTGNHQHLVMRGGLPEWVRTDELSPGDMLAVPIQGLEGDPDVSKYWPDKLRRVKGELRRGRGGWMDSRIPKLPKDVTPELAWVLAAVTEGDGSVSNGQIRFVNAESELIDYFAKAVFKLFGVETSRYETCVEDIPTTVVNGRTVAATKSSHVVYFSSKIAAQFIAEAWRHVLLFPREARVAALASLIDSDGTVTEDGRISIAFSFGAHPHRFHLYRSLLLSVGVIPGDLSGASLFICGTEAVKLAGLVGRFLRHPEKKKRCFVLANRTAKLSRGTGFACGKLLKNARENSCKSHSELGLSTSQTWEVELGKRVLSERLLGIYVERIGKEATVLGSLLDLECRWVRIDSIEPVGLEVVYDLVCSGDATRSFIANGIITHNCILVFDEFEKAVAGLDSSGQSDSGVTSRVIGTLMTWMQECKAPIMKIATCNTIRNLDPALTRRGRWDAVFGVDLPTFQERMMIFEIHLRKRGRDPEDFNIEAMAHVSEGFVGAEIESVIDEAMYNAFADEEGEYREVTTDDIVEVCKTLIPLADTHKEDVDSFREFLGTRFQKASSDAEVGKRRKSSRRLRPVK